MKSVPSIITPGKTLDNGEPMRGGMKDVYFGPDKSYVVAFYRDKQDYINTRTAEETGDAVYDSFFNREGGEYYKELYCWPTERLRHQRRHHRPSEVAFSARLSAIFWPCLRRMSRAASSLGQSLLAIHHARASIISF